MHSYDLLLTVTGGLGAALILGYVTQRLGLSTIVGYLIAGMLVGPHTPGFVADASLAEQLAELNMDTLRELRHDGIEVVYGDATRPDTLAGADVASASTLILTSAGMANSTEAIRAARELNPHIRVLARAEYLRGLPVLTEAGANAAYSGEGEVALAFIEDILGDLGATPEQIDRERERAHGELFGRETTQSVRALSHRPPQVTLELCRHGHCAKVTIPCIGARRNG